MISKRNAALLIAGHGSTVNAESSAPTYEQAENLRQRGLFEEIHECFWKEEPNFRQALWSIKSKRVYLVPNFISSGYFTEQVIPREFDLTGPVSRVEGKEIYYCEPVGLHPAMTDVLLKRATEVVTLPEVERLESQKKACLFIIGHGTGLNENSTKVIYDQVELIRSRGIYAEVQAAFMEQAPFIAEWKSLTSMPEVIAVPFFISDGLHSYEDIPVLLGMTENVVQSGFKNPHFIEGRRLWYASAIGTEPTMAEVILAQVDKFDETRNHVAGVA